MRKSFLFLIFLIVGGVSGYLLFGILNKKSELEDYSRKKQNISWINDYISQKESIKLTEGMPVVFFFFNPDCDFCQHEAQAFKKQKGKISGIQWVWISGAEQEAIDKFAWKYSFHQVNDLYLIRDSSELISDKVGISTLPQILVYSRSGKLVKEFKGETKIQAILDIIR